MVVFDVRSETEGVNSLVITELAFMESLLGMNSLVVLLVRVLALKGLFAEMTKR